MDENINNTPEQQQEQAANPEETAPKYVQEYTSDDLHTFLKVIMWLSIIFTGISLVNTIGHSQNTIISSKWILVETVLGVISIIGAIQILRAKKSGFFIMVITRLLLILVTYAESREVLNSPYLGFGAEKIVSDIVTKSVLINIGQIVFLSLLLLLRKNGLSGYDVLWRKNE